MEDFEESWNVLRRKGRDRVTTTMNVGEALTRLTTSIHTFLALEESDRVFHVVIQHERRKDSYTSLNYRVVLTGMKAEVEKLFAAVNKAPFAPEVEEAIETAFRLTREAIEAYLKEHEESVQDQLEEIKERQEVLFKQARNLKEMGFYDPDQPPLPLEAADGS